VDVALFVTCLTDTFQPRVGVAVVRVLRHFGCTVHFPPDQTCCGQPAYNNGFHAEAADLGRRFVDAFEGFENVVTPSGSCANMVVHHIPELLADDPVYAGRARRLAGRTWEFGRFLGEVLGVDLAAVPVDPGQAVTYHYSCHHRGWQTAEEASALIARLGGIDYRPLAGLDQCCGFGGAFRVLYPQISAAMSGDKLDEIARTGAGVVVCNEAGCSLTLSGAAHRRRRDVTFKHLAELLAESLGLLDDQP
jgi:L-lactate dehydrogenase complex protein LldE